MFLFNIFNYNLKLSLIQLEMINLELISENENQQLPKNPKYFSAEHNFSKIIKNEFFFGSIFKENQCSFREILFPK